MQVIIEIPENSETYKKLHAASKQSGYSVERLAAVFFDFAGQRALDNILSFLRKHHPKFKGA